MRLDNFNSIVTQTDFTFTATTTTAGQLIADTQEVEIHSSVPPQGLRGTINSVVLLDKEGVGTRVTLIFKTTSTSMGTEGGGVTITDADARNILGYATTGLFRPMTTSKTLEPPIKPIPFNITTGSIYVAILEAEAASVRTVNNGFSLRLGIVVDNVAVA